jgi:uncharacterized GH25 family protein
MLLHLAVISCCLAAPAFAHDFWITPSSEVTGKPVELTLHIGPEYSGDETYPFNPLHIVRFERVGPDGTQKRFLGFTGQSPAGRFIPKQPGYYTVGYQSRGSQIVLDAAKFEEYLHEEKLEAVLAWRTANGQSKAPGKEQFFRNAKALLRVGVASSGYDRVMGMPLELVSRSDPARGGAMTFVLLLDGKPLPDTRIAAYAAPKAKPVEGRTNAQGEATLTLNTPGRWLIKAVHARKVEGAVDWRSDWASLTLRVGP